MRLGSGAFDHITPRVFESLEEAVADLHFVFAAADNNALNRAAIVIVTSPRDGDVIARNDHVVGWYCALTCGYADR